MEQLGMVAKISKEREFDFEAYEKWKQKNSIEIDLGILFYILSYDN